ncbi:MAG: hypothetical protein ICCCNLDF_01607 [Planctomycetes bacterium]|nr:hypothetical protein [Planctomycetota bacterium]
MFYVYVMRSIASPNQVYTGITENLPQRISDHNQGKSTHTNKFKPWECIVAIRFSDEQRARAFERYLKTGSGRAFLKRHFL